MLFDPIYACTFYICQFLRIHWSCYLQITFKGATQQMHGTDNGFPARPDGRVTISNSTAERVIRVFGTQTGSTITSIGFSTTRGRTFGPWGTGGGDPFSVDGQLLGFFGGLQDGAVSGIGVWYTPDVASTVPTNMEMSPAYGNLVNVWTWDDTPDLGGAHIMTSPTDWALEMKRHLFYG
jgi:hypothetical protein